jgi:hypothetical protein
MNPAEIIPVFYKKQGAGGLIIFFGRFIRDIKK